MRIQTLALASLCSIGLAAAGCREESEFPDAETPGIADGTATTPAPSGATGEMDRQLAERVRLAIQEDATASAAARQVSVTSVGGVVTLTGRVDSEAERERIGDRAEAIDGVTRVENRLQVAPAEQPTQGMQPPRDPAGATGGPSSNEADRALGEQIRIIVLNSPNVPTSAQRITIVARSGIVTLTGRVDSEADKERIGEEVERVEGVTRVDNQLHVAPAGSPGG